MSKFLTSLVMENATGMDDGRWRLTAPLIYDSDVAGKVIVVPTGFITDLASVPRVPIAYMLAGGTSNEASVVHDYLYTSHIVDRETADAVLREASAVTGVPAWRRTIMWAAVRAFGGSHWDEKPISA
ncbi:hypothetical protein PPGU19_012240 [Paraburkholderia sp. PGU19]|uniref:DUF1353 domain-containing protein n=1 Tax=Paraburkholderia sp. PGU19 TaxID=2735434 RepID=UPI0015DBBE1A|nr:DUF1353 domain-containing protein [Paraburkholderia sp. PGU19]BCF96655.1 hypothetical protein PPGU19_012240 [Paraburkholderia sp. PGU19]